MVQSIATINRIEDDYNERAARRYYHEDDEPREVPDYNVSQRLHAIEDVQNGILDMIELMENYQNGNREQRALAAKYGEFLESMRKYRDLVTEDYDDTWKDRETEF